MRKGRRRLTKTVAAAAGVTLIVVLSRHKRAAFTLDRELAQNGEPLEADPPVSAAFR